MTAASPNKSDLATRTMSAIAMIAVAGTALWLGGWVWVAFVGAVGLGVLWEWWGLVRRFVGPIGLAVWMVSGAVYVGLGATGLIGARADRDGWFYAAGTVALVAGIDIGAYAFGRAIGGPKIAPSISPKKTWAGLGGGIVGGGLILATLSASRPSAIDGFSPVAILYAAALAAPIAIIAQAGDFFESWMKRRAGVKDSGALIPGHGGLFDRVDGLLAVSAVLSIVYWPDAADLVRGWFAS